MSEHMYDCDSCATTCSFIHTNTRTGVIQFGNRIHRRVPTKELCSGPSTRRGAHVTLRGRCVECHDRAPMSASGRGRKEFMSDGKRIPCVFYDCDVCRKRRICAVIVFTMFTTITDRVDHLTLSP